jgi:hypothetical protein
MSVAFDVEYTDTFGGEANYSWVRRAQIIMPEEERDTIYTSAATIAKRRRAYRQLLMRRAKASAGLTGVRGRTEHYGDMIDFRPYGSCTVMFITYHDDCPEA